MRHLKLFPPLLVGLALPLLGCGDELAAPEEGGIRIEATITSTLIDIGEQAAIIIRLRNLRPQAVTLTFSSTCQLHTFIRRIGGGTVYPPQPGGHACGDAITTLTLEPFAEHSLSFPVIGADASYAAREVADILYAGWPLLPGRYAARAELGHNYDDIQLRSAEVKFEVRN